MAAVAVHVAVRIWCAAVTEKDHNLVKTLGIETPKVPHHSITRKICLRIALLSMNKITEFFRIFYEKHRCVVSNKIPVAIFSIKFNCKTAWIALGVGTAFFTADG